MSTPIVRWSLLLKSTRSAGIVPRSSHNIAVSKNGLLAIYGGELKPRTPVDSAVSSSDAAEGAQTARGSIHVYELTRSIASSETGSSSVLKSLKPVLKGSGTSFDDPEPRVGATLVPDSNSDCFYLWGGRGGVDMAPLDPTQAGIWRATISGDKSVGLCWDRIPSVNEQDAPEPRSYHASVLHEGKVYIHAGCPASGRLTTMHSFDLTTGTWRALTSAPEPGRGGTVLAVSIFKGKDVILRFGGFAGYELPTSDNMGVVDIYSIHNDKWTTERAEADPEYGFPGSRSVHGFVGLPRTRENGNAIAVLYHGERDASSLGHAGAGVFWDDVWVLYDENEGLQWRKAIVEGDERPEARGWFPSAVWNSQPGKSKVVMHGGLVSSNARMDDLWVMDLKLGNH